MASNLDLKIVKGKTFLLVLRWGSAPFIYVPITSISQGAPARIVTTGSHNIPNGWRVAPVSVNGMEEINAETDPPKSRDYVRATVINPTTVDLNTVNSSDYSAYTSGGYLQHYTPVSLVGAEVRMTIKDRVGGTALLELDSDALTGIALDDTDKTITVTISAAVTAALTWLTGVYDIEIELQDGTVKLLAAGSVSVASEVTT